MITLPPACGTAPDLKLSLRLLKINEEVIETLKNGARTPEKTPRVAGSLARL
jgi:hypothetical protein